MEGSTSRLRKVSARPKLADEIAGALRQAILRGAYEPNAKLGLEELAEELGVSVMPVREALIALSNEGLVTAEPRRGFRANPPTEQDLDDLFEIQASLAGILAARAAEQATSEDVTVLDGLHREFVAATELPLGEARSERLEELNSAFHRHLSRIPAGDRVRWFLRLTTRFVRRDLFDAAPCAIDGALKDHPRIIAAIAAHDSDEARLLMHAHFLEISEPES